MCTPRAKKITRRLSELNRDFSGGPLQRKEFGVWFPHN